MWRDSLPIMVRILNSQLNLKEIIIVYDSEKDNTIDVAKDLANEFDNVKVVRKISNGVDLQLSVECVTQNMKFLITAVDEIFPIIAVDQMISHLIKNNLILS